MKRVLSVAAVALVAGLGGYFLGAQRATSPATAPTVQASPAGERATALAAIAHAAGGRGATPLDDAFWQRMRTLVREEIRSAAPSAGQQPTAVVAATPREPSAESLAAHDSAALLVANAIAARAWRNEDAAKLRALRSQMTLAQQREILRTLLPAINDGQLTVEDSVL